MKTHGLPSTIKKHYRLFFERWQRNTRKLSYFYRVPSILPLSRQIPSNRSTEYASQRQPMRYTVSHPGQPLEPLLALPAGACYTKTGNLKQMITRLAALLTINTAIWEYRHSLHLSESFFTEQFSSVRYNELNRNLSVEAVIQRLRSGSKNPALLDSERPWFVG